MNQKYFIGIDISKGKLDCAVILADYKVVTENIVPNTVNKINSFLKTWTCNKKPDKKLSGIFDFR